MKIICKKPGEADRIFDDASHPTVDHAAQREFSCFASPIIGAAYHYLSHKEAAERIKSSGWDTEFIQGGVNE